MSLGLGQDVKVYMMSRPLQELPNGETNVNELLLNLNPKMFNSIFLQTNE